MPEHSLRFAHQQKRLKVCAWVKVLKPEVRVECQVRTDARPFRWSICQTTMHYLYAEQPPHSLYVSPSRSFYVKMN
ncbi:hypothetical protein DPMN_078793 [Dreissena polymorpha]|uniref:Uncharacterized protein n=1 Tax=Dreissena polymorpha TaxID=45954 RepID=A0A9D3YR51_DREPO|nr:hypothetical protein DPMN_078793 [Dreissena polymorpha]